MRRIGALVPEDVQGYPRPPSLDLLDLPVRVVLGGQVIVEARFGLRVCETHHAPSYYLPPEAFAPGTLSPSPGSSFCEWKGAARYWTVRGGNQNRPRAAWSYPNPTPGFLPLKDHIALYAGEMDDCFVGDTKVVPQPGSFYGGWVTPNLTGRIKGAPGTTHW